MNIGSGPEDLPQFEDRVLYHLIDLAGDRPMGPLDGVPDRDVAARLADELDVTHDFGGQDNRRSTGLGQRLASWHLARQRLAGYLLQLLV
jgi:hypothetical protein